MPRRKTTRNKKREPSKTERFKRKQVIRQVLDQKRSDFIKRKLWQFNRYVEVSGEEMLQALEDRNFNFTTVSRESAITTLERDIKAVLLEARRERAWELHVTYDKGYQEIAEQLVREGYKCTGPSLAYQDVQYHTQFQVEEISRNHELYKLQKRAKESRRAEQYAQSFLTDMLNPKNSLRDRSTAAQTVARFLNMSHDLLGLKISPENSTDRVRFEAYMTFLDTVREKATEIGEPELYNEVYRLLAQAGNQAASDFSSDPLPETPEEE